MSEKVREQCGRPAGYQMHLYLGEDTCKLCRAAQTKYNKRHKILKELGRPTSSLIPVRGTIRRLQALMCLGWPIAYVLKRAGVRQQSIVHFEMRKRIHKKDADKIAKVYDELSMTIATPNLVRQSSITIAKNYAKQRGYIPPLGWDDIDNEQFNPRAQPRRLYKEDEHVA